MQPCPTHCHVHGPDDAQVSNLIDPAPRVPSTPSQPHTQSSKCEPYSFRYNDLGSPSASALCPLTSLLSADSVPSPETPGLHPIPTRSSTAACPSRLTSSRKCSEALIAETMPTCSPSSPLSSPLPGRKLPSGLGIQGPAEMQLLGWRGRSSQALCCWRVQQYRCNTSNLRTQNSKNLKHQLSLKYSYC